MDNAYFMPKTNEAMSDSFDISRYTELDAVRTRLIFKLINYERNKDRLLSLPHRRFLDLAVTYCCAFKTAWGDNANIVVTREHLKYWSITEEELYKLALKNTPGNFGGKIEPLFTALSRMTGLKEGGDVPSEELYICSNMDYFYGASAILYEGFLQKFARMTGSSFIILPSSVHEVILLPDRAAGSYRELEELVGYVNRTEVSPEEILSDKIYKYEPEEDYIKEILI